MPATVQLNTRIDPGLKARGDAVFARAGLARRMARDLGLHVSHALPDYQTLRDDAYDALITKMGARHA